VSTEDRRASASSSVGACQAIVEHHRMLIDEVARRVDDLRAASVQGKPHGPAAVDLVAFLTTEVLPHAAAEELTISALLPLELC
jgi:hypothetical protein